MTKREKHIQAIAKALALLDEQVMLPIERDKRRAQIAEAILDAIQDPPPKSKGRAADPAVGRIVALYCDLWRVKHRSEKSPTIRPQDAALIRRLVGSAGEERAAQLMQGFFQMPNGYYHQRRHPLELLDRDLNAVQAFSDGSGIVSRAEGQSIDARAGLQSQIERIRKGEL